MTSPGLNWVDILVIALYFALVLAVGIWATCRAETDTSGGYFLAGRSSTWWLIGASTYATNIGAPMFVGIPGSAASSGIAIITFEWYAMWSLLWLGWLFLPVYMASGCYTMPQYLKLRFGGQRIRTWLALVHTLVVIISGVAGQLYAGALFIQLVVGWDLYASLAFILLITAVYTVIGGLTAVLWTDAIQTIILLVGATCLTAIGMNEIGSFTDLRNMFVEAAADNTYKDAALYGNRSCGFTAADKAFHLVRPADDGEYPWTGMTFGLGILAVNAWCTDQIVVQRSLSAKHLTHAKAGIVMASYLKILPWYLFMMPGLIARVLFPQEVACSDPDLCEQICDNRNGCFDIAYPMLVREMLPTGLKGLMMAALLAALMSSLTSTFNSSSTIFTMDLWRLFRPKAKESELMVVGRLWTVFLALVSMAWMPILLKVKGSNFWAYSQSISSYLNPPIVAVFLMGICWKRTTEKGAFSGLVVGLLIGIIRMGLEWSRSGSPCGDPTPSNAFAIVTEIQYLHFACILFACCVITTVIVSLMTEERPASKLHRMTWSTRLSKQLPDITSDSELHSDSDEDKNGVSEEELKKRKSSVKYFLMKWMCGVDKTKPKRPRLTKEEVLELQEKTTNIKEDPFWGRFLNINAVIACSVCFFLHAFWA